MKRKRTLDFITRNCRARKPVDDIKGIPAVLDEITCLPVIYEETLSFLAFDVEGHCLSVEFHRYKNRSESIGLQIDIPGNGRYSFYENIKYEKIKNKTKSENYENFCGSNKLIISCLQPMRRWRLYFRGTMKRSDDNKNVRNVTISAYWQCLSDPYDHFISSSCWELAGTLVGFTWGKVYLCSPCGSKISYEQFGELRTILDIDGKEIKLRLKCVKERNLGSFRQLSARNVRKQYLVMEKTGLFLSMQMVTLMNESPQFLGYVLFPFGDTAALTVPKPKTLSKLLPVTVSSSGNIFKISDILSRAWYFSSGWTNNYIKATLNDKPAYGVQCTLNEKQEKEDFKLSELRHKTKEKQQVQVMVVAFEESVCKERELVGGKGSKLADLKAMGIGNVPDGICITTNAYRKHVEGNQELKVAVDEISKCLTRGGIETLRQACIKASELFKTINLSSDLELDIQNHLDKVFGHDGLEKQTFAVRSSSVGEDGNVASIAGQLETFLGVKELNDITDAVRKCWASSVAFQFVEYRRQNGQNLTEDMGVVIQEMVDADCAGVMFTNDPVRHDETRIIINAALGLGESVVSGKVSPDVIIVKRSGENVLDIEKNVVGEKEIRIEQEWEGKGGTKTLPNTKSDKENLCLAQDEIKQLCEKGIQVEKNMGMAQDIEWAISKGSIYILQTRPVTALEVETNEEIMHEFDTPIMTDYELITPNNVQEAIPGVLTPLSTELLLTAVDRGIKYNLFSRLGLQFPIHPSKSMLSFEGIALLNLTLPPASIMNGPMGERGKSGAEITFFGKVIKDHTLELVKQYYGRNTSLGRKFWNFTWDFFILSRKDSALYDRLREEVFKLEIRTDAETAETLYDIIDKNLEFYYKMWRAYTYEAIRWSIWAHIMKNILMGSSQETTVEHNADMALILSQCNVHAAEVPTAVDSLAKLINNSEFRDKFLELPLDDCDAFLRNSATEEIKTEYTCFMQCHGHRCVRECDFIEKSWNQAPSKLMKMLKKVIEQSNFPDKEKQSMKINEIIENLQSPLTPLRKLLLKHIIVKKAQIGVAAREAAKSTVIKSCSVFKEAYWRLGTMMVREGRLPDEKLLFFLTHREIGILLEHRSTRLIRLARRRMKLVPEMHKTKYEKINLGIPKPIKDTVNKPDNKTSFTLIGMPVCRGKTEGRACVIRNLEDGDQILEGDVLICRYTDVGWSPYFPLINGLVTELGSIMCHGAVVAREYGIPCIVDVTNATDHFKTGDRVVIDGTAGKVSKI